MIALEQTNYAVENIAGCRSEKYTLTTEDGLTLQLLRFYRSTDTPAVLLLHGLSSSSDMFMGPEFYNLTHYLLRHGLEDVWLLDWRSSLVYKETNYNAEHDVEQVALYDFPAAVQLIQEKTNHGLHVVAHCIGSMALSMTLASRKVADIRSAVLANVSLFPKLNLAALLRLYSLPQFAESVLNVDHFVVDPEDVDFQDGSYVLMQATNLAAHKCEHPGCRALSQIWGSGHPDTLFNHAHLAQETHDQIQNYLGPVSLSYFKHIQKMLHRHAVVSADGRTNYLDRAADIEPPLLLLIGKKNLCWHDSIQQFHDLLDTYFDNVDHKLLEVPNYGHMDLFLGQHAHLEVFPELVDFLKRH